MSFAFWHIWRSTLCVCSESNGGEQGFVQDDNHISMVPKLFCHPLPQQEGPAGGEDLLLPPGWLFPRIWWYVVVVFTVIFMYTGLMQTVPMYACVLLATDIISVSATIERNSSKSVVWNLEINKMSWKCLLSIHFIIYTVHSINKYTPYK